MMENYTEIPVELNKPDLRDMEEMQKKLIDMITKNKRLVEEHNRQNGTIQALNIALDVITDRYSNLRKRLCRTGKGCEQ